jgi:BON domain
MVFDSAMRQNRPMDATEPSYLHGALTILHESRSAVAALFDRFETAEDRKTRRAIVEAALHELKVHATIEELMLHPSMAPELVASEKEPRRHVARLIAELQAMTGEETRHDAKFALLSANVRRRLGALASLAAVLGAAALALPARAQSNQSGGQQLNPNTSLNSIVNGGPTGAATPVDPVVVPVTPASDEKAPASLEKDRPLKGPLPAAAAPKRRKLSDRRLRKKLRDSIVDDATLPDASRHVDVHAAGGRVVLNGTVLSEDDKYKIGAKAADLAGAENVVNRIVVSPPAP